MRIGLQTLQPGFIAHQRRPDLSETNKEALIGAESIHHRPRLAHKRDLISLVRNTDAAQIPDVFADSQCAVYLVSLDGFVLVVLFDKRLRALVELLPILVGPPAFESAVSVVLRTL